VNDEGAVVSPGNTSGQLAAFLAYAGATYPGRAMAFCTAGSTVPLPRIYTNARAAGCRIGCQTNAWGGSSGALTGYHSNPGPGGLEGLRQILANLAIYTNYVELHPADLLLHGDAITA
jgi:hypothetical protein